jgi:hypothetical protein
LKSLNIISDVILMLAPAHNVWMVNQPGTHSIYLVTNLIYRDMPEPRTISWSIPCREKELPVAQSFPSTHRKLIAADVNFYRHLESQFLKLNLWDIIVTRILGGNISSVVLNQFQTKLNELEDCFKRKWKF